jgi:hypothetical protein
MSNVETSQIGKANFSLMDFDINAEKPKFSLTTTLYPNTTHSPLPLDVSKLIANRG